MKAMIFAAGLGTRLRPLTDALPKALVDINGVPMLEIVIRRLAAAGVTKFVINTHCFHEKLEAFLYEKNFGLKIELSREEAFPLETGGGLKKAAGFFGDGKPFFACNADVYSELDLAALYSAHLSSGALATLAVRDRLSNRKLLFDQEMNLKGREGGTAAAGLNPFAFSGIQVISPEIFPKMTEDGVFSITGVYLRLAAAGEKIKGFEDRSPFWCDIGDLERLEAVRLRAGKIKPF
ncbi:MAG: nucleotidyltransferase family protein [Elusimicrobiota bacterium]|nr:nucleotidyltransferase family protein [Elusimicrobiota bacterium]